MKWIEAQEEKKSYYATFHARLLILRIRMMIGAAQEAAQRLIFGNPYGLWRKR